MNWIIVDLDCTLVDTKALIESAGAEPCPYNEKERHEAWVKIVTEPKVLETAPAVATILNLVKQLEHSWYGTQTVFLTNRRESIRQETIQWLGNYELINPLITRPNDENSRAGTFKAKVINDMIQPGDTVLVIDDDPDGTVHEACKSNGWTFLKVMHY